LGFSLRRPPLQTSTRLSHGFINRVPCGVEPIAAKRPANGVFRPPGLAPDLCAQTTEAVQGLFSIPGSGDRSRLGVRSRPENQQAPALFPSRIAAAMVGEDSPGPE
jgi:hypothetical protein